ncbi:MAG: hypothetical protein K1X71_20940, partial [Pirellulales bacterium]|nr:hypothetical protein [Pirellulales bacterium]
MAPKLDLPRALLRGRYMAAAARIEWAGTPIDTETLADLREAWPTIKTKLIAEVDADYGVYVPTGSTLDASTPHGAAVFATAEECGIDPYRLQDALEMLWREERDAHREVDGAVRDARKATGLTANRIAKIEDAGGDHSAVPHLDAKARELAAQLPALGLGRGYRSGESANSEDPAAGLWQLLREPSHRTSRTDPALMRRAAELVVATGDDVASRQLSFSAARFGEYLTRSRIPWPHLPSGALDLSDNAFRQMARQFPAIAPLRELRYSLSQLRLNDLAVGADGRNRCLLSAFASRTGRNQPSNARFIFGPSVWLRGLIQPAPGRAVAYLDWCQQEFGIAAALSGDARMADAYSSGDPYLAFAKQAGAVPADATKQTHAAERERFKVCALAVQYGMAETSLAAALGQTEAHARDLLRLHRETYPRFWRWSQAAVDHAMLHGYLETVFGWRVHV